MPCQIYLSRDDLPLERLAAKSAEKDKTITYSVEFSDLPATITGVSLPTKPLIDAKHCLLPYRALITIEAPSDRQLGEALKRLREGLATEKGLPELEPASEELRHDYEGMRREEDYKRSLGTCPQPSGHPSEFSRNGYQQRRKF